LVGRVRVVGLEIWVVEVLAGAGSHRRSNTWEKSTGEKAKGREKNVNFMHKTIERSRPARIGKAAEIGC
jgi:hypothetical protein